MKLGELSTAAATPIETIRYFEREGLLPAKAISVCMRPRIWSA